MNEFKAGDRVKIVGFTAPCYSCLGTVAEVDETHEYPVSVCPDTYEPNDLRNYRAHELELVPEVTSDGR